MPELTIWVPGVPQPQGSIQYKGRTRRGKPILTSDNQNLKPWRVAVTWAAQAKLAERFLREGSASLQGAVEVEVHFVLSRPKSHFGVKGNVLPSAPAEPIVKPDVDKLGRAILDGLADAGTFLNDSQVTRMLTTKAYTTTAPGAAITVRSARPLSVDPNDDYLPPTLERLVGLIRTEDDLRVVETALRSAPPRQESQSSIPAQEQAHGTAAAGIRRVVG